MKQTSIWLTLSLLVASVGCDIVGGGIAGAGRDAIWRRREADNYESTVAKDIQVSVITNPANFRPEQHFKDIMRSFATSADEVGGALVRLPSTDYTAQYKRNVFEFHDGKKLTVEEKLPAVFNMHTVRLGIGTLSGREIIMIVNKSRSSTGRYFVAIYSRSGNVLYRTILTTRQVWDIQAKTDVIEIIGAKETRRITLVNGSKQAQPSTSNQPGKILKHEQNGPKKQP